MQIERRSDPQVWTGEIMAAVLLVSATTLVAGVQIGRSIANAWSTGVWQLAPLDHWVTSVPAVLGGDSLAGLNPAPSVPAPPELLRLWVGVMVVSLLVACTASAVAGWRAWGARIRGVASVREVHHVLGRRRLHRSRRRIRPDLYPPDRRTRRTRRIRRIRRNARASERHGSC